VRLMEMAHREYGRLPWSQLFRPAIALAESGFDVSPRLHALVQEDAHLKKDAAATAYFYEGDSRARPVGARLRNPELAAVFGRIAREGSRGFYEGEIAQAIVDKVRGHPTNPGRLS